MARFVSNAFQVTYRNLLVWRSMAVASAVGYVGEPLLSLVALGFGLGKVVPELDGMPYAEFIAPGLVASTAMYTATFECTFGAYTRLVTQRTYDAILATPIAISELVAGEILYGGLKSCFGGTIVLLVATAFGLVPSWTALFVPLLAFVAGLLFAAMGIVVAASSKSYDVFSYYFTLVIAPMYLFAGVFFPLSKMPGWVLATAQVMPMTHVVELSRALVRGTVTPILVLRLGVVLAFTGVAFAIGFRAMGRRVVH
jgi:lipooligosaccharide transport system permease protein